MGPIEVTLKNLVNVGTVNISYIESLGMCMLPHIFLTWCMTSTWAVRKVPWRIFTACHGEPRRKTVLVGCSHSLGILAHLLRMVSNGTYKWPMRFVSVIGHPNHQLRIWRLMPRGHSIHEGNWKWRILRILKYCFLVDIGIIIALAGAERSDERSDFPWFREPHISDWTFSSYPAESLVRCFNTPNFCTQPEQPLPTGYKGIPFTGMILLELKKDTTFTLGK